MTRLPDVPRLETERLILRGRTLADFEDFRALWADPEITRYVGRMPFDESNSWARFLRHIGHWAALGYGYWIACERASGRFVGEVGFAEHAREIEPSIRGIPECGWALARWAHGRGLATEAVRAALEWGDARFDGARTVCLIEPENAPSRRVAAKCGFREALTTSFKGSPILLCERPPLAERARVL